MVMLAELEPKDIVTLKKAAIEQVVKDTSVKRASFVDALKALDREERFRIRNINRVFNPCFKNPWDDLTKGVLINPPERKVPSEPLLPRSK